MQLPRGVFYHPRQERLIAVDEPATIRIETGARYPGNASYRVNDRSFEKAIAPYLLGDWEDFDRRYRLSRQRKVYVGGTHQESDVIYSGAEHRGDPKLPNITVLPNLTAEPSAWRVFGCTMGHYHPIQETRVQEVYEFQSYGLLALDRQEGEMELWVARDGDKIAVPNGVHMTLYNLDDEDHPLITLDFADPDHNLADKDLIGQCGPVLLACYNDLEAVFTLNRLYLNNPNHSAGVRLPNPPLEESDPQIKIARGARLSLGQLLYERLTRDPDVIGQFARLGLRLRRASPEAVLTPLSADRGSRLYFTMPLAEAVAPGTEVHRYFFPKSAEAEPGEAQGKGIIAVEAEKAAEKERMIELTSLNRRLMVVVEGGGDWVEQAYRKAFKNKADKKKADEEKADEKKADEKKAKEGRGLSVFYADDTRWRSRPAWADQLEEWETYLDKTNPADYAIYQNLRPDVVFVVTPDFTHSAITRGWLGRTPLVFVEKPFDSQIDNVDALLRELGRKRGTAVLGLDHYQLYALPVHEMMPEIVGHLGGALAGVVFYMTESRSIESNRDHSLQHGLTLDLLPHFPALLAYFGDVGTIDEIRVLAAGQYRPLITADRNGGNEKDISDRFRNETHSRISFTFRDYSGNGHRVPCLAVVGKGLSQEVKYMQVIGRNGRAVRLDLNRPPSSDEASNYPWDSLFFLHNPPEPPPSGAIVRDVDDPYCPQRRLHILDDPSDPSCFRRRVLRERYEKLLDDLLNGTSEAVASTLLLTEAPEIVEALDRIWRAVQDDRPAWKDHDLGRLNPVQPNDHS